MKEIRFYQEWEDDEMVREEIREILLNQNNQNYKFLKELLDDEK